MKRDDVTLSDVYKLIQDFRAEVKSCYVEKLEFEPIKKSYVSRNMFEPVRNIVYGFVGLILTSVMIAILSYVVISAKGLN